MMMMIIIIIIIFIHRNKPLICEDNIEMDLQAVGWGDMDWTGTAGGHL